MAKVPMPSGPSVEPGLLNTQPLSLQSPKRNYVGEAVGRQLSHATDALSKSVAAAYDRFSKTRADDAYNTAESEVNELLLGEQGALREQGDQVVKRGDKKSFAMSWQGKVDAAINNAAKDLDPHQRALVRERLEGLRSRAKEQLLNHQIKQSEAYDQDVARVTVSNAGSEIAINITDPEAVSRGAGRIASATFESLMKHSDPAVRDAVVAESVSKAVRTGIELQIGSGNIDAAGQLLNAYKDRYLSGIDALELSNKIKRAAEQKTKAEKNDQALQLASNAFSNGSLWKRAVEQATGQSFDVKKGEAALKAADGDLSAATTAYLTEVSPGDAEASSKRVMSDFKQRVTDSSSVDRDVVVRQLTELFPDATSEDIAELATKEIRRRNVQATAMRAERNLQAKDAKSRIDRGEEFDSIPITELSALTHSQIGALKEYDRRKSNGTLITDSGLFYDLMTDNVALKKMDWSDVIGLADRLSEGDYQLVVDRKTQIEGGGSSHPNGSWEATKRQVDSQMEALGYTAPSGKTKKAKYGRILGFVYRAANEYVIDNGGKVRDEDMRRFLSEKLRANFVVKDGGWFGDSETTFSEILEGDDLSMPSSLKKMVDAALGATGVIEPQKLDRTEYLLGYLVSPQKNLPGARALIDVAPARLVNEIRAAYKLRSKGQEPSEQALAKLVLEKQFTSGIQNDRFDR